MAIHILPEEQQCSHTMQTSRSLLMHHTATIECPQPRRPLKRGIFEIDTTDVEHRESKRWCQSPGPLPETHFRSRSDSFLLRMSSRPTREVRLPKRYDDIQPNARNLSRQNMTPQPSPSISPPFSESYGIITPGIASESRTPSRISHANYRNDLKTNNIYINTRERSAAVIEYASAILKAERDSPRFTEADAQVASDHLCEIYNEGDEAAVRDGYSNFDIVPHSHRLPRGILRGGDIPFDMAALPRVPMAPPLGRSKPDHHYCYSPEEFTPEQKYKNSSSTLQHYSAPSSTGNWPFLTLEFKSQAKGGRMWVAENQVATSSALLTCSVEQLLSMTDEEHRQIDSISFAFTMDARNANAWVSYCAREESNGQVTIKFHTVEVKQYSMQEPSDIVECRNAIRNVLGWAIKSRLPMLLSALDEIKIVYPDNKDGTQCICAADTFEAPSN